MFIYWFGEVKIHCSYGRPRTAALIIPVYLDKQKLTVGKKNHCHTGFRLVQPELELYSSEARFALHCHFSQILIGSKGP